ncbi:MAG: hypothetical protein ABH823_02080 [bacterium]
MSLAQAPQALWDSYGLLVNDTPGNASQQKPKIQNDERGNYIVVWEDGRAGYYDIYAQKINSLGQPLWPKKGVAVCAASRNQNFPQITKDGTGGAIIVWQDYRNGNADVFAQRLGSDGLPMWPKGGVAVCATNAGQFAPQITPDGSGGAIITWHDYRSGQGEDIYAQRINNQGTLLWQRNGVPIATAPGTQWYPQIVDDGAAGAVIVWTDGRVSSADNNIYAQRVNSAGEILWPENGVAACLAANNQEQPIIIKSNGGTIITWQDYRNGNADIFAQKLNSNADPLWQKDGVALCSLPYAQENQQLADDGNGGALVTWADLRGDESAIYAQRINQDGQPTWQENGYLISSNMGKQSRPEISQANNDSWVIVWENNDGGKNSLLAQRITVNGAVLWPSSGLTIASAKKPQETAAISPAADGSVVAAWADNREGNSDIYAQRISLDGDNLWPKAGVNVCSVMGSVVQQNLELAFDGQGGVVLVFEDARSGYLNIYAQKINRLGKLLWGEKGIAVAKVAADQIKPQIVSDGLGGAFIAWQDNRHKDYPKIRAQHINNQGASLWESSLSVAPVKSRQENPVMVSDSAGGVIITWEDDRDILSLHDLYVQRISGAGKLLWGENGKVAVSANGHQLDAAMIADGAGGIFLAWTDFRKGDRNPDIYAQKINARGNREWTDEAVLVCGAPDVQRVPKLTSDGAGGIIVAWTDKGGGSYDIYAQRLSGSGQSLWMADGIPINQLSRTQQNPQFANSSILIWEDYRFGNWDIFAGSVDSTGKLAWGEEGIPLAIVAHTQYTPQVTAWKNNSAIVVWEDYRSSQQYEIFIQKITAAGQTAWADNGVKILTHNGAKAPRILSDKTKSNFYVFWEDFTGGGRALYGQKFSAD